MKTYYYTGEFARLANVSERTVRYYDTIGLLKPSFLLENGYRCYTQEDLLKLQQIISLKHLGFSLQDIMPIVTRNDKKSMQELMLTQTELLDKKIRHFQVLKDSISAMGAMLQREEIDWEQMLALIQLSNAEEKVIEHYKDAHHLSIRTELHRKYSINPLGWFPWIYGQIDFSHAQRILEVGCGDGRLWDCYHGEWGNKDVFLSDVSAGMVEEARKRGPAEFNYMEIDAMRIPFADQYFDCVIANHTLFYLGDVRKGIQELARVLKPQGRLYCTTYGGRHMREITDIARAFDPQITLSETVLYEQFGLDNGEALLRESFAHIEKRMYEDALIVDEAEPIFDYILSCHGNQRERIGKRVAAFLKHIEAMLAKEGALHITKEAGMFIAQKG